MYHNIFDTHAHYDHRLFNYIRHAILSGIQQLGVSYILNCGSDEDSSLFSSYLASIYPFIWSAAGIHPHAASRVSPNWEENLQKLLDDSKNVAIGEIGLDYHYNFSEPKDQRRIFSKSIEIALSKELPVIIHDREAHEDILAMLKEYRPFGVVHRFSGSIKMMEELIDLGFLLGFGCSVVYENAKIEREAVSNIPIDRLLLETDCPYLPPPNSKNEICRSDMIGFAAEAIAKLRPNFTPSEIISIATENGKRLFKIPS